NENLIGLVDRFQNSQLDSEALFQAAKGRGIEVLIASDQSNIGGRVSSNVIDDRPVDHNILKALSFLLKGPLLESSHLEQLSAGDAGERGYFQSELGFRQPDASAIQPKLLAHVQERQGIRQHWPVNQSGEVAHRLSRILHHFRDFSLPMSLE